MNVMAEFESIMAGMERSQREKKTDVVKTLSKGYVLVDTCYTIDHGYETMVFKCDSKGNVKKWDELDSEWYDTWEEALRGHDHMRSEWAER